MTKKNLQSIMVQAWSFVKRNGYTMSEALKCAWANFKLKNAKPITPILNQAT